MTPDEAKLLGMADESLRAARLLLDNDFPGFAASRAYYAMFAAAEALLLSKDLSFSKHSAVIAAFGQHFAKTGVVPAELHRSLLAAQRDRQVADYDAVTQVTREDAERHVQQAQELLRCAAAYLNGRREGP